MQSRVCASFRPLSEDSRCLWGDAGGPRGQRAGGHRGKFGVSSVNKRVPTPAPNRTFNERRYVPIKTVLRLIPHAVRVCDLEILVSYTRPTARWSNSTSSNSSAVVGRVMHVMLLKCLMAA